MPAQAFTLVLDGNPTPEATSRVFEIAQRDAEWQTAFMEAFPPQNVDHGSAGWGKMVANHSYVMRGFPEAIRGITENTSPLISCNFEPARDDKEKHLRKVRPTWTRRDWNAKWYTHKPRSFATEPPLPSWLDLRFEDALPGDASVEDY
ncbi:hypothetical protein PTMSG1_02854 [Pyrenophora teres f. maculata]|nr:hypothetical protein PTMSG1_02854 [Pyrenophora teres f. maculata]